ncbi:MAG: hypothetical protein V3T64_16340, partial [Myxococcota bacterium]
MRSSRAEWIAAIAVASFAGGVFLARVPAMALLGFDSYPEILTSRVLDFSGFLGTFTEQTSEGLYPYAFYRPIFNLSLAFDYAIWGLEPRGYHLTTISLVGACGLSLFWLSKCLLGHEARWGRWATLLIFLVMPVQLEIIPLISRRMDLLCGLFSVLALATQVLRIRRPTPIAGFAPAVLTGLAIGSKEAGVAVVPVICLLAIALCTKPRLPERIRFAGRVTAPHLAAVAFVFAARFAAIGGLGGHPSTDPSAIWIRLPKWLGSILVQITSAWAIPQGGITEGWLYGVSAITLIALVGLCLFLVRREGMQLAQASESRSELTAIGIGGTWIV